MKEQTTVISTTVNGETRILMPITKLENIEDTATVVDAAADGDFIPIMDSNDEGQMKKISVQSLLGNIITAANNAETAANNAEAAASNAQAAVGTASSAATPTAFSVGAAAWTTLAEPVAECGYSAEIAASGVTATDIPDVYFDKDTIVTAKKAGIIPDTNGGNVVLYAMKIPEGTVSGVYYIKKGAVG